MEVDTSSLACSFLVRAADDDFLEKGLMDLTLSAAFWRNDLFFSSSLLLRVP